MGNGIKIKQTTEGKYYGEVSLYNGNRDVIRYETPKYLTEAMAYADSKCWKAFHMTDETTPETPNTTDYTIDADDAVYTRTGQKMSGEDFAEHLGRVKARNAEIEFRISPFTQSTKKGFHLIIVYPRNTPSRKFTIIKADQ